MYAHQIIMLDSSCNELTIIAKSYAEISINYSNEHVIPSQKKASQECKMQIFLYNPF